MTLLELAKQRHSVRSYQSKEVEREKLLQVLEAGRLAPSAVNFQPFHFIVITEEEGKSKVNEAYPREWLRKAPVIIVVCGDHSKSWKRKDGKDHCDIDAAIAIDHMTLAATDLGLGTCWICAFDAKRLHENLELPANLEPIAIVPFGYPDEERVAEKVRRSLDEMVSWENYK
ncbi:MAG TPA: nitroreductase family protein [Mobilitalea sp.]|nr:nitroreductase family protein [Mobilitalea sp.]